MGFFWDTFNSLEDLYVQQLEDVYDAENRLVKALQLMEQAATNEDLKAAFRHHTHETQTHVERLDQVFRELGRTPKRVSCEAMKGLLAEGDDMMSARGDDDVRDAGLIAAAQRVEHYEIASYGTLRTLARRLGYHHSADLLQQTLEEETAVDHRLTDIAEHHVNATAQQH